MGWSCEAYLFDFVKITWFARSRCSALVPCLDEGSAAATGAEDFVTAGRRRRCSTGGTVRDNTSELCWRSALRGGR